MNEPIVLKEEKVILIIAYAFPPVSSAIGTRSFKLAKYLKWVGWKPIVLTIERGLTHNFDQSLFDELETCNIETIRVGGFENRTRIPNDPFTNPYRFLDRFLYVPDPYIKIEPFAIEAALPVLNKPQYIDFIYAFGHPWSAHNIAIKLKYMYSIPIALDFSLPWVDHINSKYPTFLHKILSGKYERDSIRFADMIITSNRYIKELVVKKYFGIINHEKIVIIPNGYDELDFKSVQSQSKEPFLLTYYGDLQNELCNKPFIQAVKNFIDHFNLTPEKFKVHFMGNTKKAYLKYIRSLKLSDFFVSYENLQYKEIIQKCESSHAFWISETSHPHSKAIATFKLQFLIGFKKPILGLVSDDYLKSLISKTGGYSAERLNANDIADNLGKLYTNQKRNDTTGFNEDLYTSHNYNMITRELSKIISRLLLLNF
ncbi:hypothetical protein CHS0354_000557 [Potamilus streckersoni]|uniref:Glycosyltransferase subfamily 4-like N-terminal domain-containing protein n=1 Tax=Potamilus streckersoni TaxID=2493646 RepID=A0AAE0T7T7_9BIVA|nr:hypothetical protein CHS0354_000557 [Potamilus streckersoni]